MLSSRLRSSSSFRCFLLSVLPSEIVKGSPCQSSGTMTLSYKYSPSGTLWGFTLSPSLHQTDVSSSLGHEDLWGDGDFLSLLPPASFLGPRMLPHRDVCIKYRMKGCIIPSGMPPCSSWPLKSQQASTESLSKEGEDLKVNGKYSPLKSVLDSCHGTVDTWGL